MLNSDDSELHYTCLMINAREICEEKTMILRPTASEISQIPSDSQNTAIMVNESNPNSYQNLKEDPYYLDFVTREYSLQEMELTRGE